MKNKKAKYFYWLAHLCKIMAWPSWWIVYHRKYHRMPNAFKRTIKGPGVIICNHNHWIEAPLIVYTFPMRTVVSIISDVILKNNFSRWFFNRIGAVIINKNNFEWSDFKKIINVLRQGKLVLLFPEGIMNDAKELATFKEGLVTITYLANVPIYPIYIDPKHKSFHCQHIMLGETIDLHKRYHELNTQTCKMMTNDLWEYVNVLKKQLEQEINS